MLSGLINTGEKTMVIVGQINSDGGTQMRAGLDEATVQEYAEKMENGWGDFPPVVLYHDGTDYWLADGFHRLAAYKKSLAAVGDTLIPADVRAGTRRDAILHAAGANANHGLRRSPGDKRRAVEVLLKDEEWGKWSDAEIARRCNVSPMTVGRVRAELISNNVIDTPGQRLVRRGGTTYAQNTANIGANRPVAQSPQPALRRYRDREGGAQGVDPWVAAWTGGDGTVENGRRRLAVAMEEWVLAWTDDKGRTWRDVAERNPWHANSPFRQVLAAECQRRRLWLSADVFASVIREVFSNLARKYPRGATLMEAFATPEEREIAARNAAADEAPPAPPLTPPVAPPIEMPLKTPPDDRITRAQRLIELYRKTIASFDDYGDLIGAYTATLTPQREMEKLIRHLEREIRLLNGEDVLEDWSNWTEGAA